MVSSQAEVRQLEMFAYVRPLQTHIPTNLSEDVLQAVRFQRQERLSIASELFDINDDSLLDIEQIRAISKVYFDRHPNLRPHSPDIQPKKQTGKYFVFTVFFCNPYSEPPGKKSRCLLEIRSDFDRLDKRTQAKFDAVLARNPGYSQGWSSFDDERIASSRKWSQERKIANRLRLLEKRIRSKFSILQLADQEIERQVMLNPQYFGRA